VPSDSQALLAAGGAALEAGDWSRAQGAFEGALEREERAEALLGLGTALYWLGENDAAVRCLARAHAAFRRGPDRDPARAVSTAVALYFVQRVSLGAVADSRGWLGRAARLVDECGLEPSAGWILLLRAHDTDDPAASETWGRDAHEAAVATGDADLALCALSQVGAALVRLGRVEEGLARLDEAAARAVDGDGRRPEAVVFTTCTAIVWCSRMAAFARARRWIRAGDEFNAGHGSPHVFTVCRVHHGAILFTTGDWAGAETELEAAVAASRSGERALHAEALTRLAELRLAQGRLDEAARLIAGCEDQAVAVPVLGAVRLAGGQLAAASAILRRRLRALGDRCLECAPLLELLCEVEIAQGALGAALSRARTLVALGETLGCPVVAARGMRALGRALAARGDGKAAAPSLERARDGFARLGMPLDAARARLLLADALRDAEPERAVDEAREAPTAFESLGAARDAEAAAALLLALGVRTARSGPRATALLSPRELEVLALLGEGLDDGEIAARLALAPKAVEHHVDSVRAKLGLRGRPGTAVHAARALPAAR
jgi:DNA-binding CsgD family transcriptional regulator